MKILVTGSAGYVGSVLVGHLLSSTRHQVVGVDSLRYSCCRQATLASLGHPRFAFHHLDVRDEQCLRLAGRADAVVHLAALVGAPLCEAHTEEAVAVNQNAAIRLARSLSPSQRLVYACTNSGYGASDQEVTEESPLLPLSVYGRTKVAAEEEVLLHPQGVSLRLATVFGVSPRMRLDLLVNDFVERLLAEGSLELYEPDAWRNAVHVRDVAEAILHAVDPTHHHQMEGGSYNVVGVNLTKKQFAWKVCDRLGLARDRVRAGQGSDPDGRDCRVSGEKLAENGFRPSRTLEMGIDEVREVCEFIPGAARLHWRNA